MRVALRRPAKKEAISKGRPGKDAAAAVVVDRVQ